VAQRDATAMVETKGEYNRTFNPDNVRGVLDGVYIFVCPDVQQYTLHARPEKKSVINGEVVTENGVVVEFREFTYRTTDETVADLIRKSNAYKRGTVRELGALRQETKEARLSAKAKEVAADPELTKAVLSQLKQGKAAAPEVVKQ
jgi:hypothetical protein